MFSSFWKRTDWNGINEQVLTEGQFQPKVFENLTQWTVPQTGSQERHISNYSLFREGNIFVLLLWENHQIFGRENVYIKDYKAFLYYFKSLLNGYLLNAFY